MARVYSAALPIAYVVLRILIVLNWLMVPLIVGLLAWSATFTPEQWELALKGPPTPGLINGLRAIALLGLAAIPLNYALLKRLLAIVETVRAGDPFVAENAYRLQAIAWILLALQLLSIVIGSISHSVSTSEVRLHMDAGFSISGWLAVLLAFILARVFAEGALMREDLEGTI